MTPNQWFPDRWLKLLWVAFTVGALVSLLGSWLGYQIIEAIGRLAWGVAMLTLGLSLSTNWRGVRDASKEQSWPVFRRDWIEIMFGALMVVAGAMTIIGWVMVYVIDE